MKHLFVSKSLTMIALTAITAISNAQTVKTATTGIWNQNSTWSTNSKPSSNSILIIPAGDTVTINNDNDEISNVTINVYGTLIFTGEAKLKTKGSSIINVYSTGYVVGSSSSQKIKMGSSNVWKGSDPALAGLTSCDAANNCYTNAVLPVELLEGSFSIDQNEKILQTEWTTASEQNNEYFHIEYSTDYMEWKEAAVVMGAGNSNNDKHYSNSAYLDYPDNQKDLYVRLSQVDFDGQRALLLEETVNIQTIEELEMNPNPASDYLVISGNTQVISALVVTNIQGEFVTRLPLEDGIYRVNIKNILSPGYYFIHVMGMNDEILFSKKQHITF